MRKNTYLSFDKAYFGVPDEQLLDVERAELRKNLQRAIDKFLPQVLGQEIVAFRCDCGQLSYPSAIITGITPPNEGNLGGYLASSQVAASPEVYGTSSVETGGRRRTAHLSEYIDWIAYYQEFLAPLREKVLRRINQEERCEIL